MIDTTGNSDNLKVACMALDIFTKSWCIDCEFSEKHNHLTFRCDECEFCTNEGDCLIKKFVTNHTGDLPKSFGCMGHLSRLYRCQQYLYYHINRKC